MCNAREYLRVRGQLCGAGRREWPAIQKWCHKHMETALHAWFGNVEVVREGTTPFDPQDKFIFGYTPHGLFPIGSPHACIKPTVRVCESLHTCLPPIFRVTGQLHDMQCGFILLSPATNASHITSSVGSQQLLSRLRRSKQYCLVLTCCLLFTV